MSHIRLTFEELLPQFAVRGNARINEGPAPDVAGDDIPPSTIISTTQDWHVQFNWRTRGALNYIMCGKWHLSVILEEMGKGEFHLPNANKYVKFVAKPNHYSCAIQIPAGVVPPGVYKPVVTLTMTGQTGRPGPIAAFGEGRMTQFYDAGPLGPRP